MPDAAPRGDSLYVEFLNSSPCGEVLELLEFAPPHF